MSKTTASPPHIALLPSAGMGHLPPFLRLASMLSSRSCTVTLITASPSVSAAESSHISFFLSQHPQVKHIEFQVLPCKPSSNPTTDDPFFLQFEASNRSVHHLYPSLASASPPLSAIFSDFAVASSIAPVAADLGIPNYIISTTSCKFFCLMAYLPVLLSDTLCFSSSLSEVNIPGITPLPLPSIPPPFKNPSHLFTSLIATNAQALSKAKGILMNTFDDFEPETLAAINSGRVLDNLPPILPIGPLETFEPKKEQDQSYLPWLDSQPAESVVYVSFGSRTAMSSAQITELSKGLERSGYRFLWEE
ncbi:UDP-glycosyltransferase 708C1-like [Prunus avium]|uniref:UDP-glycosyltransferase 708C1-like n=1 Tax=Prunus avium TaxID=42229 RepID=A0A6P5SF80_PRUAV|nr:UDP-glycosyltransferase 708C1-like [Prunus avium]